MTLTNALNASISGLNATQAGIDVVSRNIANAGTPGYTRKTLTTHSQLVDGRSIGVAYSAAQRDIDLLQQQQLRVAQADTIAAQTAADYLSRIDTAMGSSNSGIAVSSRLAELTDALQAMATTPENAAIRANVLNEADDLADSLNSMSDLVQSLRLEAEAGIGAAIEEADVLLKRIATINEQIVRAGATTGDTADLADQRDRDRKSGG